MSWQGQVYSGYGQNGRQHVPARFRFINMILGFHRTSYNHWFDFAPVLPRGDQRRRNLRTEVHKPEVEHRRYRRHFVV
jgi:hypothetical protein